MASSPLIGELLSEACKLGEPQIQQILAYQRKTGMRFGEAAVALRLVERKDVLEALYQQFQYTPGFRASTAGPSSWPRPIVSASRRKRFANCAAGC